MTLPALEGKSLFIVTISAFGLARFPRVMDIANLRKLSADRDTSEGLYRRWFLASLQ